MHTAAAAESRRRFLDEKVEPKKWQRKKWQGQKVARKRSSNSQWNFHDFSEEAYNCKTEMVEEDIIANNLNGNPPHDENHDPMTIKSAKKEENTNEDLDGVVTDLKKYECFVCDKKFCFRDSRKKHMIAFHKNVCHICGSTFQTSNEITKHISGN